MKILIVLSLILSSCTSDSLAVKRIDPNKEKSLSGYWNDTDSKLVSDELIGQVLEANWLSDFTKTNGKKPLLVIGRVSNKTSEHLKTITFVKDIERNLINSGRVRFVAGMQERKDLRSEKIDQQKNADFIPAEIVEIEHLTQTKTSWLALMLQDYQQILTPTHSKQTSQQATLGSIAIKMETSQTPGFTSEKTANYLKNMKELVSRLRQSMEEW